MTKRKVSTQKKVNQAQPYVSMDAYKRIQTEYDGIVTITEQLDMFQQNFNCGSLHFSPNFKNLDAEAKERLHKACIDLENALNAAHDQVYYEAHKAIKSLNKQNEL